MTDGAAGSIEDLLAGDEAARTRMRRVHETLKAAKAPRPRVAVVESVEPPREAGAYVPEMVKRAGGIFVSPRDAGIILVAPPRASLAESVACAERLRALADWNFARDLAVVALDARSLTSPPGSQVVDGIEVMARLFNPSLFPPLDPARARAI